MRNLPRYAVERPVLTSMIFLALLLVGAVSFTRLQVDLLPEIDFPSISVVTTYDGAGPEEIETLITEPMERAVSTIEGVDRIESFSTQGRSRVALRFVWGTNLDTVLNDVRSAVERAKQTLPEGADAPTVYKFNLGSFPILNLGLSSTQLDEPQLRELAELQLGPRLERIEGVASVEVRGGLRRQVRVELDSERLGALGVSADQVVAALRAQNQNVPVGVIDRFDRGVLVRTLGEAAQASQLSAVIVGIRKDELGRQQPIRLDAVARIVDDFEERTNSVRINGKPGIRLSLLKQSGENTVAVAARARAELDRINRDYKGRLKIDILSDTSEYIENSISNVQQSALIGAVLAVLVLLAFLRRIGPTVVVAIGIPVSIIGMFTLMYAMGITLNLISFGGVALGVGMLVDNSIVVLENIYRKIQEGEPVKTAAYEGAGEVATAVIASTITTLAVFVPVIFLSGFASIFFGQMAFVVSFALACSLAVALTLLPMMSSKLLRKDQEAKALDPTAISAWEERVGKGIDWCTAHPTLSLLVSVVILASSLLLVPSIGTELLPEGDQSEIRVKLELPEGTRLEVTEAAIQQLEQIIINEVPETLTMQTVVGTPGFWSTSGQESADVTLQLVRPNQRTRSSEVIARQLQPKLEGLIPSANIRTRAGGGLWVLRVLRGGGEERLEVQIRGEDLKVAGRLSASLVKYLEAQEGISSARSSLKEGALEYRVVPDPAQLASRGLTPDMLASQLQSYIQGTRASVLRDRGQEYDVLVQLRPEDRKDRQALLRAPIILPNQAGAVPLQELATVEDAKGPLTINRENQSRVVYIRPVLDGTRDLGTVSAQLRTFIATLDVPDDFAVLIKGESEEQDKNFKDLVLGIVLAIVLVYMVMASQFESLLQPLYIMCSIPFAATGVLITLVLTGTTFNLQSFMGCIVLTGIVVNNAIVLIDYMNLLRREQGWSITRAVRWSARRRLRPILMTSATTILALVPVAIGLGEGSETQAPLAWAVIGGLTFSSAVTLVIIPIIYQLVEGWLERRAQAT